MSFFNICSDAGLCQCIEIPNEGINELTTQDIIRKFNENQNESSQIPETTTLFYRTKRYAIQLSPSDQPFSLYSSLVLSEKPANTFTESLQFYTNLPQREENQDVKYMILYLNTKQAAAEEFSTIYLPISEEQSQKEITELKPVIKQMFSKLGEVETKAFYDENNEQITETTTAQELFDKAVNLNKEDKFITVEVELSEAAQQNVSQRSQFGEELIESEKTFIEDLQKGVDVWKPKLVEQSLLTEEESETVFGDLIKNLSLHQELLTSFEQSNHGYGSEFGRIFVNNAHLKDFASQYTTINEFIQKKVADIPEFSEKVNSIQEQEQLPKSLNEYLHMPIERIEYYQTFINKLIEITPENHLDYSVLPVARDCINSSSDEPANEENQQEEAQPQENEVQPEETHEEVQPEENAEQQEEIENNHNEEEQQVGEVPVEETNEEEQQNEVPAEQANEEEQQNEVPVEQVNEEEQQNEVPVEQVNEEEQQNEVPAEEINEEEQQDEAPAEETNEVEQVNEEEQQNEAPAEEINEVEQGNEEEQQNEIEPVNEEETKPEIEHIEEEESDSVNPDINLDNFVQEIDQICDDEHNEEEQQFEFINAEEEEQLNEILLNEEEQDNEANIDIELNIEAEEQFNEEEQFDEIVNNEEEQFNEIVNNEEEQFDEIVNNEEEQFDEIVNNEEEQFDEIVNNEEEDMDPFANEQFLSNEEEEQKEEQEANTEDEQLAEDNIEQEHFEASDAIETGVEEEDQNLEISSTPNDTNTETKQSGSQSSSETQTPSNPTLDEEDVDTFVEEVDNADNQLNDSLKLQQQSNEEEETKEDTEPLSEDKSTNESSNDLSLESDEEEEEEEEYEQTSEETATTTKNDEYESTTEESSTNQSDNSSSESVSIQDSSEDVSSIKKPKINKEEKQKLKKMSKMNEDSAQFGSPLGVKRKKRSDDFDDNSTFSSSSGWNDSKSNSSRSSYNMNSSSGSEKHSSSKAKESLLTRGNKKFTTFHLHPETLNCSYLKPQQSNNNESKYLRTKPASKPASSNPYQKSGPSQRGNVSPRSPTLGKRLNTSYLSPSRDSASTTSAASDFNESNSQKFISPTKKKYDISGPGYVSPFNYSPHSLLGKGSSPNRGSSKTTTPSSPERYGLPSRSPTRTTAARHNEGTSSPLYRSPLNKYLTSTSNTQKGSSSPYTNPAMTSPFSKRNRANNPLYQHD